MGYPPRLLNEHEQIHVDSRPHWSTLITTTLPPVALLIITITLAGSGWLHGFITSLIWLSWLIALGFVAERLVRYATTEFVVTGSRIILRKGLLSKSSIEIPLDRITNTSLTRSLFERLVGDGDLVIESAGKDSKTIFDDIPDPEAVQRLIQQLLDDRVRPANPSSTTQSPSHLADQLERLTALHAAGSLSDAEFAAAKQRLLATEIQS